MHSGVAGAVSTQQWLLVSYLTFEVDFPMCSWRNKVVSASLYFGFVYSCVCGIIVSIILVCVCLYYGHIGLVSGRSKHQYLVFGQTNY